MVKLVYVVRARDDVEPAEFRRYWLEKHGPRVRSVASAIRARRYVQSHRLETPLNDTLVASRSASPTFEGITEVWWDSLEDLQTAAATEEGMQAMQILVEDESRFIDLARSTLFLTEEHEIFGPGR